MKRFGSSLVVVAVLWSVAMAACASAPATPSSPPQPPTTQPAASPSPLPPTATVAPSPTPLPTATPMPLYSDDFSNPESGWEHYAMRDALMDYQDGQYRMWIKTPNILWVEAAERKNGQMHWPEVDDAIIVADVQFQDGPAESVFGLRCETFVFLITPQAEFGIAKMPLGVDSLEWLGQGLQPSEALHPGKAPNHLQAECVGDTLRFSANGVPLAEVTVEKRAGGTVGLVAGALQNSGTDVLFDNFQIFQP